MNKQRREKKQQQQQQISIFSTHAHRTNEQNREREIFPIFLRNFFYCFWSKSHVMDSRMLWNDRFA